MNRRPSIDVLFSNPDFYNIQVSPNGKFISYLAPVNDVLNIFYAPINNIENSKQVTNNKDRNIEEYFWCFNNAHILHLTDNNGDENWHIQSNNLLEGTKTNITPFNDVQVRIVKLSPKRYDEIVVAINNRIPEFHDLYVINVYTGESYLLYENNTYFDFTIDDNFNLRFGYRTVEGGEQIIDIIHDDYICEFMRLSQEESHTIIEDKIGTKILDFTECGTNIYMSDSRYSDLANLTLYNLQNNTSTNIYTSAKGDLENVIISNLTKKPLAISYNYDRQYHCGLNADTANDLNIIASKIPNADFKIVSRSLDDNIWIIKYYGDVISTKYYAFNKKFGELLFLFDERKKLNEYELMPTKPTIIKSRDNLEMMCYITLPKSQSNEKPMVLIVHGGPTYRDKWGELPEHQWLASIGYSVVSVNYRGSSGFGKNFVKAGNGEWSYKAHDDLIDVVEWAISNGICNRGNVAIFGGSYGGYAALLGITITADVFACAVDLVGPSSLETVLETFPKYWQPMYEIWKLKTGGNLETESGKEELRKRSPITYLEKITKPLLIAHGSHDVRVKKSESDQIVKQLKEKNVPVTYLVYDDEGHGFTKPNNHINFLKHVEAFLAKNLKM